MNKLVTKPLSLRDKMFIFEDFARILPKVEVSKASNVFLAQTELRVEHKFSFGVYARTLYIPKGAMFTGQIHKYENLNILLKGKLQVSINDEIELIEAPFTYIAPPNSKRIFYSLEESIWMTVIGTHQKDIDKIESEFTAVTEQEYLEFCGHNQLQLELDK